MVDTYTRQASFSSGNIIKAEHGNAEFNKLVQTFHETTGHNHDGTPAGGAAIPLLKDLTLSQDLNLTSTGVAGSVVRTVFTGTSTEHLATEGAVTAYVTSRAVPTDKSDSDSNYMPFIDAAGTIFKNDAFTYRSDTGTLTA